MIQGHKMLLKLYCIAIVFLAFAPVDRSFAQQLGDCRTVGIDDSTTFTGTYLITAPKLVRPGFPYSGSISILRGPQAASVTFAICDEKNSTIAQTVLSNISPGTTKVATIDNVPASLTSSSGLFVCVKGQSPNGATLINDRKALTFEAKSSSIFIQTDKAVYKPGDLLQFRVLALTSELKPVNKNVNISLSDPKQNVIKLWQNEPLTNGVTSQSLLLSEEPPLGEWSLKASIGDQQVTKSVSVDKYVLPRFEVNVEVPTMLLTSDDIPITVKAKYTYGKGVRGKVVVGAQEPNTVQISRPTVQINTELNENGEVKVTLKNADLRRQMLVSDSTNQISIVARVTEELTSIERNASVQATVYETPYRVEIQPASESFKVGLQLPVLITVENQDGSALARDAPREVKLAVNYNGVTDESGITESDEELLGLGPEGEVMYIIIPPKNTYSISLTATYASNSNRPASVSHSIQPSRSPTNNFLQLSTSDQKTLKVGETAKFTVLSTAALASVTMQVTCRGLVVLSRNVAMSNKEAELSFVTTNAMAPKARLVVYGVVDSNKEILVDALYFEVEGLFQNKVSVSFEPKEIEPYTTDGKKNQATLTVRADAGSFVGVLAVDQSVQLLKTGNDITADLVETELASYDATGQLASTGREPFNCPVCRKRRSIDRVQRDIWWPSISGQDAGSVFENSGMLVLTDAYLYGCQPDRNRWDRFGPVVEGAVFVGLVPGGMGTGAANKGGEPPTNIQVRSQFPETWLWLNGTAGANGQYTYRTDVPDTITTWIASAFAISDKSGLGLAAEPARLKVYRPFFVVLNLPYAIKRGEQLGLQVIVFNYMSSAQSVTVQLERNANSGFDFVPAPGTNADSGNQRHTDVPSGASKAVYFPIVARVVGTITLTVKAWAQGVSDGVTRELLVDAEGVPLFFNKPMLLDLTTGANQKLEQTIYMDGPQNGSIVQGSEHAEFSLIGDVMGPTLQNVDDLVRMPYGCGEQNMLGLVPNIVVMRYLTATNRLTSAIASKAKVYMESGYQRELTYKRSDNSFSAFGQSEPHGSTWLTAFVVRSFKQATPYIFIDDNILKSSMGFLIEQQEASGAFKEHGEVHHKDMQGGAAESTVALTAYVLLALLENNQPNSRAQAYLEQQLDTLASKPYPLAVTTYALTLANSNKKDAALAMLEKLAITKDEQKHWAQNTTNPEDIKQEDAWWYRAPQPLDVEMTSYALLTYVARSELVKGLPVVRWLTNSRNDKGGFGSTQDTAVGLQALAAYAEKVFSSNLNLQVTVEQGSLQQRLTLTPTNSIVLQKVPLRGIQTPVKVTAEGSGLGFAQVAYHYNVPSLADAPPFDCTEDVREQTGNSELRISMCCKYALRDGRSNMAVVQMDALSGYEIDKDKLELLPAQISGLQRVETHKDDAQAAIYFNSIGPERVCFNVSQQRVFPVSEQKPANIKVFDYYKPVLKVEKQYSTHNKRSLLSVCPECWPGMSGHAADPVQQATTTEHPLVAANCTDTVPENCVAWMRQFPRYCTTSPLAKRTCAKSCKMC